MNAAGRRSFATAPYTDLIEFAEKSIKKLKETFPGTHTKGLLRVDVMQTCDHKMVVNEFESLEAMYAGSGDRQLVNEFNVSVFLTKFWLDALNDRFAIALIKNLFPKIQTAEREQAWQRERQQRARVTEKERGW